jgi:uncharacterized membrane protein YphA (DoxX/SURF4 family)
MATSMTFGAAAAVVPAGPPIGAAGLAAMPRAARIASWLAAGWIAWEFGYYEQYKLTGNEGSVHLFGILSDWLGTPGGEKPFRLFVGIQEIIAAILVLLPWTRVPGAALSFVTMAGAIFFHVISPLGIDPYGDGGMLFKEAVFTLGMSALVLALHRREIPGWLAFLPRRGQRRI